MNAHDFVDRYFPEHLKKLIDIDTVRVEDTELTPTAYQGSRRADVIYSVRAKASPVKVYALLHLEGQSTHQAGMALRILEYHTALAAKLVRQKKYKKLPLILTFVLYHGKATWTSKKSIAELFENFDEYVAVGLKQPFLIDLPRKPLEEIITKKGPASVPLALLHLQAKGDFCEAMEKLYPIMVDSQQNTDDILGYMASYDQHGAEGFFQKLRKLDPEKSKDMVELFKEEKDIVRRETALRVRRETALRVRRETTLKVERTIASNLLKTGMDAKLVSQTVGLRIEKVKELLTQLDKGAKT